MAVRAGWEEQNEDEDGSCRTLQQQQVSVLGYCISLLSRYIACGSYHQAHLEVNIPEAILSGGLILEGDSPGGSAFSPC